MWQKHKTSIVIGISICLLLSAFWYLQAFAFIFFLSLLLTLLLLDPVDELAKSMPRGLAAATVLFSFLLIAAALIAIISSSFIPTLSSFSEELPNIAENIKKLNNLTESGIFKKGLDEAWAELSAFSTQAIKSSLLIAFSAFNKLIDLVIILFLTFYLLMDGEKVKSFVANLFPNNEKKRIHSLIEHILTSLRIYIRSQLIICFIMGVIVYLYFTLMGLPYASVFAVASGLSEFIPVLGPTLASSFGILMTAIHTPDLAIPTAAFYLIMTQLNHNLIYPSIVGKSLHLHPIAIILGIVLGGELLDAAGMFLAVPFIVVIKHVIEDIHEHSHFL